MKKRRQPRWLEKQSKPKLTSPGPCSGPRLRGQGIERPNHTGGALSAPPQPV